MTRADGGKSGLEDMEVRSVQAQERLAWVKQVEPDVAVGVLHQSLSLPVRLLEQCCAFQGKQRLWDCLFRLACPANPDSDTCLFGPTLTSPQFGQCLRQCPQ